MGFVRGDFPGVECFEGYFPVEILSGGITGENAWIYMPSIRVAFKICDPCLTERHTNTQTDRHRLTGYNISSAS